MGTMASQITSLTIVYSTVYSEADQRKHQSSASLAFVWGIHRGPVNSPHKWPVTRKMFPFDDVIMMKMSKRRGLIKKPLGTPFVNTANELLPFEILTHFFFLATKKAITCKQVALTYKLSSLSLLDVMSFMCGPQESFLCIVKQIYFPSPAYSPWTTSSSTVESLKAFYSACLSFRLLISIFLTKGQQCEKRPHFTNFCRSRMSATFHYHHSTCFLLNIIFVIDRCRVQLSGFKEWQIQ